MSAIQSKLTMTAEEIQQAVADWIYKTYRIPVIVDSLTRPRSGGAVVSFDLVIPEPMVHQPFIPNMVQQSQRPNPTADPYIYGFDPNEGEI